MCQLAHTRGKRDEHDLVFYDYSTETLLACSQTIPSVAVDLPGPPSSCSLALRQKMHWGAGTSAYQVRLWLWGGQEKSVAYTALVSM